MLNKSFLADVSMRRRTLAKGDVKDAFMLAPSFDGVPQYLYTPKALNLRDDQGRRMVIRCNTSVWGQDTAGGQFEQCFCECLNDMGWSQAEGVPYLWRFVADKEHDASLITIVDDYLMSETEGFHTIIDATNAAIAASLARPRAHRVQPRFLRRLLPCPMP